VSDFGNITSPRARKQHRCEYCYGPIPKGEQHKKFVGMWDGDWQYWRMHNECLVTHNAGNDYDDGFLPGEGEMPERVRLLLEAIA
jgi:hypothetical protein